ncbi:hypothetical protein DFH08DRAFT_970001 [Mycena albidolilacea]|uniref:Uncharacterized protein n=1 Tax=Mycena albidolilacea TaxID=1033008 RepID=A0AAD6ZHI7_9AGAR|nr:hypothetical protein DFH08DRAFT_970001 [Mycena albidolilacea]
MPPKRTKLDPDTKAQRCKEASAHYRAKNPHLRNSARQRIAQLHSQVVDDKTKEVRHAQKLQVAAAYRERKRKKTAQAEEERRCQEHIEHELKRCTVKAKTRCTLGAHPPSDDELQLSPLPSPKEYHSESDVDSGGSARLWGPIHCPGRGPGVYTTIEQVNRCLRDFEGGLWAQASTWDGIVAKWKENCMHHHSHLIDLSPHSSMPSTPATRASSTLPDASDASLDASGDFLLSPHRIPPVLPCVAATDSSLLPQLQQELASACLDAAVSTAEAAAQRITGLVADAEAAVRRIGVHAEVTFGHLQRASSAARLIGEWADQALEVLAEARLTAEQALPDGQSANVQDD